MMTPMFYVSPKAAGDAEHAETIAQQLHKEVPRVEGQPDPYRIGVGGGTSTTGPELTSKLAAAVEGAARTKKAPKG